MRRPGWRWTIRLGIRTERTWTSGPSTTGPISAGICTEDPLRFARIVMISPGFGRSSRFNRGDRMVPARYSRAILSADPGLAAEMNEPRGYSFLLSAIEYAIKDPPNK